MVSFRGFLKWLSKNKHDIDLKTLAVGMNSTISIDQNLHILMLDYDVQDLHAVKESIHECQKFWNLADCYIYKTKNGFHALFYYDIMPYERCKMIIDYAKYVDPMFKYISRFYAHRTLRTVGKHKTADIQFLLLLPGKREPTKKEWEWGELKRKEHSLLMMRK